MELIHKNPFRILGLSVDSSEREITKRISDLETAIEFGKKVSYETDFLFLSNIDRTPESVREAANRIETAESRFFYSLFWFWSHTSSDELALDVLKDGNIEKTIKLLEGQFKEGRQIEDLYSTAKNLSILYLAISRDNGTYNFEKVSKGLLWAGKVLDANLLSVYAKHIAGKNFTFEKHKVIGSFIDEVVKTATPHIDNHNGITLSQFISKFSSFPEENRRLVSDSFLVKYIKHIEDSIKKAELIRKTSPENADKAGDDLYKNTKNDLSKISDVLSLKDFQYQSIADKLAEEIADCSISYYNYHINNDTNVDPGDNALRLARSAYSVAVSMNIKQRLKEGIPIIEKWVNGKTGRLKQQRIKKDYDFIIKQINDLPDFDEISENKIKLLPDMARLLLNNCKPKIDNISTILGTEDETYIDLSSAVVNNAMGMIIFYANETGEFSRIINIFTLINTFAMDSDVKKQFDQNFINFRSHAKVKGAVDGIVEILKKVDGSNLNTKEVRNLVSVADNLITICKTHLLVIKPVDDDLHLKLSSAIASNALGLCIEYANQTKNMINVMPVMRKIGEMDMDESLSQRYSKNFQIMMSNISVPTKQSGGACYVATMVYGSYDAPEVLVLRNFRDSVLSKSYAGKMFIKFYYNVSPILVDHYKNNKNINILARRLLDLIIRGLK